MIVWMSGNQALSNLKTVHLTPTELAMTKVTESGDETHMTLKRAILLSQSNDLIRQCLVVDLEIIQTLMAHHLQQ